MNEFKSMRSKRGSFTPQRRVPLSVPRWSEQEDRADIGQIFFAIWRRKFFIMFWATLTAVLFYVITALQPTMYTARTTLILDSREQQVIAAQDQIVGDLQINNPVIEGEIAVLRSRPMLEQVVLDMGIERFDILDPANGAPGFFSSTVGVLKEQVSGLVALLQGGAADEEPTAIPLISPEQKRINRAMHGLREGLSVYRVGSSYVMEITVTTVDPVLSADTSNSLAQTYIDSKISNRQNVVESATRWLSEQVEERRVALSATEAQVEQYKREQLAVAGTTREMIELQLPELSRQLGIARADLSAEQARLEQLEAVLEASGYIVVAETFPSSFLTAMRIEQEKLAREDARLAGTLGENHPDRLVIAVEVEQIDRAIEKEVENTVQSIRNEINILTIRKESLDRDVQDLETQLSDLSNLSQDLRQLEGVAEVAREHYESMLGRLGEARAQSEIQRSEAQIISLAQVPTGPSSPRMRLMTAFGLVLGLSGALIAALMLELMTSVFKRAVELENATRLPVLAVLPKQNMPKLSSILKLADAKKYSLLSERLRALRTVLTMSSSSGPQSILLLSSVSNEGKTTTALGLASFYARSGASVILVDLDTRRSALMALVKEPPDNDLSDYLNGTSELADVIIKRPELDFDIATTAKSKAYMADRLDRESLCKLIETLKKTYDIVIVDAPPVLAVSDGLRIGSAVDHILYLVRWKSTSQASVQYGLSALRSVNLAPSGFVLTMAEAGADPAGYAESYEYT